MKIFTKYIDNQLDKSFKNNKFNNFTGEPIIMCICYAFASIIDSLIDNFHKYFVKFFLVVVIIWLIYKKYF